MANIKNRPNLSENVYEAIKRKLGAGELEPGVKIKEEQLAKELGVSRTPVREALNKLEREGLVEIIPRYGTFVANLSPKDVEDIYEVRGELEGLAIRLCFSKLDEEKRKEFYEKLSEIADLLVKCESYVEEGDYEPFIEADISFHDFIVKSSENSRLIQIMNNLNAQIQLGRMESFSVPGRAERSLKEHEEIMNAMLQGEVNKTEKLIKKHCMNIKENVLRFLKAKHKK